MNSLAYSFRGIYLLLVGMVIAGCSPPSYSPKGQRNLATLAVEVGDVEARLSAVRKLRDQKLLEEVAKFPQRSTTYVQDLEDKRVRFEALLAINDESLQMDVALAMLRARYVTVERVINGVIQEDQDSIARIACESTYVSDGLVAVKMLRDQKLIAKVALAKESEPLMVDEALIRLNDTSELKRILRDAATDAFRKKRAERLWALVSLEARQAFANADRMALKQLLGRVNLDEGDWPQIVCRAEAGELSHHARDSMESIARVRLFTQEPVLKRRLPKLRVECVVEKTSRRYELVGANATMGFMDGELVVLTLLDGMRLLSTAEWETKFPSIVAEEKEFVFRPAELQCAPLLREAIKKSGLTDEERAQLEKSAILEVREAAGMGFLPELDMRRPKFDMRDLFRPQKVFQGAR